MKKLFGFILFVLCTVGIALIYSCGIQEQLSDNLLRMHIIANSNSEFDQDIKFQVRDRILSEIDESSTLASVKESAEKVLESRGIGYKAAVMTENCVVPKKEYKDICLPEGNYNCLKVILGSGDGENWWCVAYPPLCFTEDMFGELSADGKSSLETVLDSEALKTIISNGDINIRFKIVEDAQKLLKYLT